jgi:predicted DNA-binding protein (MmcQ/YjbR family)
VDQHELKARCLALPGTVEEFPFGDEVSVFKAGGKMFAACRLGGEPLQLSVRCEPELAVQLRATYPAIAPGYHLNKRHWNTITLDGSLPDQMVPGVISRCIRSFPRGSRISAARTARSAQSSRGLGLVRRSTATSCRSTSNSMSLDADERPSSTSQPQSRMKIR